MPYIQEKKRSDFTSPLLELQIVMEECGCSSGDLNYLFTKLAQAYLECAGLNYAALNDVVGALEGAKAEFQRRVVAPYEDGAIERNGDVYFKELTGAVDVAKK